MDLPVGKQDEQFWREHVERLSKFKGSQTKYCADNGVTLSRLVYYKQKFSEKPKFSELKSFPEKTETISNVENRSNQPRLPDAKWLSQLIRELMR